ncbi:sulfatase [Haloarchaeobius sp. DYHT-AS-18]|uniref:sulfatase n=1 Tax=Haloarchaeobius sp. DYHT-AS-18 TaxID=3446117 RepID=UPI003EBAB9B3
MQTKPNLIFIILDTTRAKTFNKGINEGWLPGFAKILEEGVYFDQTYANAPWTLPSHASIFTGKYPSEHKVDVGSPQLDVKEPVLSEILNSAGYTTGAISANPWISKEHNFDRGFDDFTNSWDFDWDSVDLSFVSEQDGRIAQVKSLLENVPPKKIPRAVLDAMFAVLLADRKDNGAKRSIKRAENWISSTNNDSPYFLFMNLIEPHLDYRPPKEIADVFLPESWSYEQSMQIVQEPWEYVVGNVSITDEEFGILRQLYKAEIKYLDKLVHRLYKMATALESDTLFLISSDHGENIGEHGLMDHQYSLSDTLIHVPLIASSPSVDIKPNNGMVELKDLFHSIRRLGIEDTESFHLPNRNKVFSEYLTPQPNMASLQQQTNSPPPNGLDQSKRAIRTPLWKLIENSGSSPELYDMKNDIGENENLAKQKEQKLSNLLDQLVSSLGPFENNISGADNLQSDVSERLKNLGYI